MDEQLLGSGCKLPSLAFLRLLLLMAAVPPVCCSSAVSGVLLTDAGFFLSRFLMVRHSLRVAEQFVAGQPGWGCFRS